MQDDVDITVSGVEGEDGMTYADFRQESRKILNMKDKPGRVNPIREVFEGLKEEYRSMEDEQKEKVNQAVATKEFISEKEVQEFMSGADSFASKNKGEGFEYEFLKFKDDVPVVFTLTDSKENSVDFKDGSGPKDGVDYFGVVDGKKVKVFSTSVTLAKNLRSEYHGKTFKILKYKKGIKTYYDVELVP